MRQDHEESISSQASEEIYPEKTPLANDPDEEASQEEQADHVEQDVVEASMHEDAGHYGPGLAQEQCRCHSKK